MTHGEAIASGTERLREAGVESAGREALLLISHVTGFDRAALIAREGDRVGPEDAARYYAMIERRLRGEPVHRIIGSREFHGLALSLSPDTLEPRDDTETLVEAVLERLRGRSGPLRIADLGTGTGAIALALLSELPDARLVATDISAGACAVAKSNARALGLADRMETRIGSWCGPLDGMFDAIVSNPPYIASGVVDTLSPEVRDHDPRRALDGGADGCDAYRDILGSAGVYLREDGFIALEIGFDQRDVVSDLAGRSGWREIVCLQDFNGLDRVIVGRPVGR